MQELLPEELKKKFLEQGDTSHKSATETKVIAKYFTPFYSASWFVVEYFPEEEIFFGYANLGDDDCAELGYVSLNELKDLKGPGGIPGVERDEYFESGKYTLQQIIDCKGHL